MKNSMTYDISGRFSMRGGVDRDEMRELDRKAIEDYKILGALLMENAGRNVAEAVIRELGNDSNKKIVVICGKGNNGGDGYVIARHLVNYGCEVQVFLLAKIDDIIGDGDAGLNLRAIKNMKIETREVLDCAAVKAMIDHIAGCDLVIDSIFGTGLKGELREPAQSAISELNKLNMPVIAVDIPSGLDCNEGEVLGACVKAKKTVTFALPKKGFFVKDGPAHVGELVVTDISIPKELMDNYSEL